MEVLMATTECPLQVATTHLRLKPDGRAECLTVSPDLWPDIMAGKLGSFHNEYLVTMASFDAHWSSWEVHPHGDEIVILMSGAMDFILDTPDGEQRCSVRNPGEFIFVTKGVWHTANVVEPSIMLFITAGEGTEGRPRT
jgi:mannose-6-phosphate isomerase-like protein (cupin superfamily)